MGIRKNNQTSYSHTYIENNIVQFFGRIIYAIKNRRKRLILRALVESETMNIREIKKYLQEKDFVKKISITKIRDRYLNLWLEVGVLQEKEKGLYKITTFGKNINKAISGIKEIDLLPIPIRQRLYPEFVLLVLRDGRKTYKELKLTLNLSDSYKVIHKIIKRLENTNFVEIYHPHNLIRVPYLFHFTMSSYYYFIEGIKDCIEKTNRPWFTEYSVIQHLNQKWLSIFGRTMDLDEARNLLEKGIEMGGIIKTNGSYEISIRDFIAPTRDLTSPEKKILDLIKDGYSQCSTITAKSGFYRTSVNKILKRLEKRNLVKKDVEYVTVELTEKGKRLADSLFKIKEYVAQEVGLGV